MSKFKLGQTLRDRVSGFTGIAMAKVEFYNGCERFCLEPKIGSDGKTIDGVYFDIQQLEYVDDGLLASRPSTRTGGNPSGVPRGDNVPRN